MVTNANLSGSYRLWTPNDTAALLALREKGASRDWLALVFKRSPKAIKQKLEDEREKMRWQS